MADQTAARTHGRHEPVAIVGIGCRLPAAVEDPNQLWQALL
ncbi:beta-ketoacyl synthase N-terminal-like domain-containing protein, partial [Streptomyces griseus]